jgi:hypothetical protein
VLSADFVAGNTAELLGLGVAGLFVGLFGVPWMILLLGLTVTTAASLLWRSHRRDPATGPGREIAAAVDVGDVGPVERLPVTTG